MSSTVPSRRSGIDAVIPARYSSPRSARPSVMMLPGITALTVMPLARQLDRGGAHEAELAGLAGAVVGPAGEPGDGAGDGRGQDDPAPPGGGQGRQARLHRQDAALQVGAEHLVDLGLGHVGQLDVGEDPGVGAQHVDAAEAVGRRLGHPLAVLAPADVGEEVGDLGPARAQVRHRCLRRLLVPAGDQDAGPAAREHPGDSLADATGGTGDHHCPAGDGCEHAPLPFRWRRPVGGPAVSARRPG